MLLRVYVADCTYPTNAYPLRNLSNCCCLATSVFDKVAFWVNPSLLSIITSAPNIKQMFAAVLHPNVDIRIGLGCSPLQFRKRTDVFKITVMCIKHNNSMTLKN